jgi:hypothetical protein
MNIAGILCLPLAAALSLTAGAAPSLAAPAEEAPTSWPPADTGGRYLPVPEWYYAPTDIPACGTTVTVASGDVRDVRYKARVKRDGTTVVKYRGGSTVDLIVEPDPIPGGAFPHGAFIDELDVSGPVSERISADRRTVTTSLKDPSIIFPLGPADAAALAEEGLPRFFYFERGKLTIEARFAADPKVSEPTSVQVVMNTARGVHDLCAALGRAAGKNAAK